MTKLRFGARSPAMRLKCRRENRVLAVIRFAVDGSEALLVSLEHMGKQACHIQTEN